MVADPKPIGRYRASAKEWKLLREQVFETCEGCCIACGESWEPALGVAHIIGRDEGGDDVLENLTLLCGYKEARPNGCHVVLQEHRTDWEKIGYRVRGFVLARESRSRYILTKVGQDGFDKRFPMPEVWLGLGDLHRSTRPDPALRLLENGDETP